MAGPAGHRPSRAWVGADGTADGRPGHRPGYGHERVDATAAQRDDEVTDERVTVHGERGCSVVRLHGEVDHGNAELVERDVLTATRAAAGVVIDLTGVTFLDSAGLRCLDQLVTAFRTRQAPVLVVAPDGGAVRGTLDLIGFLPDLLAGTLDEALAELTR
ncbi:STAS domain-containing protein [Micromonospora sp. KC721]|nr:STAS domain-containing protein [Micromonospora sp. KC721]